MGGGDGRHRDDKHEQGLRLRVSAAADALESMLRLSQDTRLQPPGPKRSVDLSGLPIDSDDPVENGVPRVEVDHLRARVADRLQRGDDRAGRRAGDPAEGGGALKPRSLDRPQGADVDDSLSAAPFERDVEGAWLRCSLVLDGGHLAPHPQMSRPPSRPPRLCDFGESSSSMQPSPSGPFTFLHTRREPASRPSPHRLPIAADALHPILEETIMTTPTTSTSPKAPRSRFSRGLLVATVATLGLAAAGAGIVVAQDSGPARMMQHAVMGRRSHGRRPRRRADDAPGPLRRGPRTHGAVHGMASRAQPGGCRRDPRAGRARQGHRRGGPRRESRR